MTANYQQRHSQRHRGGHRSEAILGDGGAAGALEAVAAVDQLSRGYVHPSINCEAVHPEIRKIEASIPHTMIEKRLDHVIKASFGFGDVNGCLLFRRWDGRDETR